MSKFLIDENTRKVVTLTDVNNWLQQQGAPANADLRLPARDHGAQELKVHTELFNNPITAGANRRNAMLLVQEAVVNELDGNHELAAQVFQTAGIPLNAGRIEVNQMAQLQNAMQPVLAQQQQLQQRDLAMTQRRTNAMPNPVGDHQDLQTLMQSPLSQVAMTTHGANRPLIVESPNEPGGGALLKLETAVDSKTAATISQAMNHVSGLCQGLPFETPLVESMQPTGAEVIALMQKTEQLKNAEVPGSDIQQRLEFFQNRLAQVQTQEDLQGNAPAMTGISLTRMQRVEGVQFNNLPLDEKVTLMRSADFARDLGRLAAISPMFGLSDHGQPNNTNDPGYLNAGPSGQANISNFMISPVNGRPMPVDYNSHDRGQLGNEPIIGLSNPDTAVMNLARFVNGQSPEESVRLMLADIGNGMPMTPVAGVMDGLFQYDNSPGASGDILFKPNEAHALRDPALVGLHVQENFARHFLEGAREGLGFIQAHIQDFEQAYQACAQASGLDPTGERHFMTAQQLQNIQQGLDVGYDHFRNLKTAQQGVPVPVIPLAPPLPVPAVHHAPAIPAPIPVALSGGPAAIPPVPDPVPAPDLSEGDDMVIGSLFGDDEVAEDNILDASHELSSLDHMTGGSSSSMSLPEEALKSDDIDIQKDNQVIEDALLAEYDADVESTGKSLRKGGGVNVEELRKKFEKFTRPQQDPMEQEAPAKRKAIAPPPLSPPPAVPRQGFR